MSEQVNMRREYGPLKKRLEQTFSSERIYLEQAINRLIDKQIEYGQEKNLETLLNKLEIYVNSPYNRGEVKDGRNLSNLDKDLEKFGLVEYFEDSDLNSWGENWYGSATALGVELYKKVTGAEK